MHSLRAETWSVLKTSIATVPTAITGTYCWLKSKSIIYMESRKTVLTTVLRAGQQRRQRHKAQIFGHSGRRRGWDDLKQWHWNIYITMCKIDSQWEFGVWCREPKASALWQQGGRWERGLEGRGHVDACGRFMLMYGRDHHSIVK